MTSLVYMFSFLSGNALPSVNKVEISKLSKKVWIFLQINCNVLFLPLIPKKILLEKFKESFLLFHFRKIFFSWAEKCYGATSFCHRHQKNQENSKKIYPRSGNSRNFCSRTNPKLAENSDGSGTRKFWVKILAPMNEMSHEAPNLSMKNMQRKTTSKMWFLLKI